MKLGTIFCRARVNTRFNLTNDFAYAKRTVPNPAPHGVRQQEKQIMKQLVLFIAVAALVGCSGDKSPVTAGIDSAESGQSVTDSTETKATKTDKSSSSKAKENQLDESGDESERETKSSSSSKSKSSSSKAKSSSSREPETDTGASEPDTAASELEGYTQSSSAQQPRPQSSEPATSSSSPAEQQEPVSSSSEPVLTASMLESFRPNCLYLFTQQQEFYASHLGQNGIEIIDDARVDEVCEYYRSKIEGNTSFHKTDHVEYCLQQVAEEYPRYWERTLEGTEKTLKQRCLDKLAE